MWWFLCGLVAANAVLAALNGVMLARNARTGRELERALAAARPFWAPPGDAVPCKQGMTLQPGQSCYSVSEIPQPPYYRPPNYQRDPL